MNEMDQVLLDQALGLLGEYLTNEGAPACNLVVCGGAALIACSLVKRTTADVDVAALMTEGMELVSPDPLPVSVISGAQFVARTLSLPDDWLNNGPSRNPGGLYQLGLPDGLAGRLKKRMFGDKLTVWFLGKTDQIFFKLYAAVDSGPGRHVDDLLKLGPTDDELEAAARWAGTHDGSDGFRVMLVSMLTQLGFENVAERL